MSGKTMFCGKCGSPLQAGDQFCENCGAPVPDFVQEMLAEGDEPDEPSEEQPEETPEASGLEEEAGHKGKEVWARFKYLILAVIVAVAALIVILILVLPRSITLTKDYLDIDLTGYNGYGTVTCSVDVEALARDYGDKIRVSRRALGDNYNWISGTDYATELLVDTCVDTEVVYSDPSVENGYLSNEYKVVIQWNCDEKAARTYFKVRLRYLDITYTISDLPETRKMDVFDDRYINVSFDGVENQGTAEVELTDMATQIGLSADDFLLSKEQDLCNGDVITVYVNEEAKDLLARESGIVPSETERTYTVKGLEPEESDDAQDVVYVPIVANTFGEYLCDFSSSRLITSADMAALERSDYGILPAGENLAQMMINEIYARHGYRFQNSEIQRYFSSKSWYQAIGSYESSMDVVKNRLSSIEKQNVEYLEKLR